MFTVKHPQFDEYVEYCEKQANFISFETITLLFKSLELTPVSFS